LPIEISSNPNQQNKTFPYDNALVIDKKINNDETTSIWARILIMKHFFLACFPKYRRKTKEKQKKNQSSTRQVPATNT